MLSVGQKLYTHVDIPDKYCEKLCFSYVFISDTECFVHEDEECLQCLKQNECTKDCQVPENVSKVFDKVYHGEGEMKDKEKSFIDGILEILQFLFMPMLLWLKLIRFTVAVFSFLVVGNWLKLLVEPLTSFLLGNNFVTRSKVNLARFANIDGIL